LTSISIAGAASQLKTPDGAAGDVEGGSTGTGATAAEAAVGAIGGGATGGGGASGVELQATDARPIIARAGKMIIRGLNFNIVLMTALLNEASILVRLPDSVQLRMHTLG